MLNALAQTRVLLVDDDELVARGFGRLLQRRGHEVTMSPCAEDAVTLMATKRFDVVVSDIMMPGGGGLAMLRAVRAMDADLPVILMTGAPTVESAMQAVEGGALKYLMKPLVDGALEKAVEDAAAHFQLAKRRRAALASSDEGVGTREALGRTFDSALAKLWMAYQPIISWSRQELFGFEALLRTSEPAVPHPGVFLETAEKLNALDALGRTIRDSIASTLAANPGPASAFVNLHASDLSDETLYSAASPLTAFASRIVLEITERASIDHVVDLQSRVARLRSLGFRIAIDDLGAGYAGLTTIAQLEPDIVKLDMSLVRGVTTERTKRKLISSIVGVCRDLGIQVVAEGIETPAERDTLVDLGCDLLQGYLFGRPQRSFAAVTWSPPLVEAAVH
jgi:EAL domain-containing protein (putative c-di-GMP-specific phosphodiesterase class I)